MAAGSRFASAAPPRGIGAEPLGEKDERRRAKWRGRELASSSGLSRPESPFDPLPLFSLLLPGFNNPPVSPLVRDPCTAAATVVSFVSFDFPLQCSASFACFFRSVPPPQRLACAQLPLRVSADSNFKLCQNLKQEEADLLLLPGKFFISPKSQTQTT